jgi:hypothetical protein
MHVTQNELQALRGVSQMQRPAAIILSIVLAQGAMAQCTAPAANTPAHAAPAATHPAHPAATQAQPARPGAELIKTAAASTRDDAPPTVRATAANPSGQDHPPRRGGTAMLLAALALMSGIALRRYGAHHT